MESRPPRMSREETGEKISNALRDLGIRNHVTYNGRGTARYVIIDVEQNRTSRRLMDFY